MSAPKSQEAAARKALRRGRHAITPAEDRRQRGLRVRTGPPAYADRVPCGGGYRIVRK